MGTCAYFLRAVWPNKIPDKTKTEIKALLLEFAQGQPDNAYDYWQEHRSTKPKAFWTSFKKLFPKATILLNQYVGKDCDGLLSGHMDYGGVDALAHHLNFTGNVMTYSASDVWHFSEWDLLCNYLKTLGAIRACYVSEESTSPGDILEAQDSLEIVRDILKNKKALPTLIGISPILDAHIANIMKG